MTVYFEVGSDTVCFAPFVCIDKVPGRRAVGEGDTRARDPAHSFLER
jgi:hypothetical protein